jgi:hypothetical protein
MDMTRSRRSSSGGGNETRYSHYHKKVSYLFGHEIESNPTQCRLLRWWSKCMFRAWCCRRLPSLRTKRAYSGWLLVAAERGDKWWLLFFALK